MQFLKYMGKPEGKKEVCKAFGLAVFATSSKAECSEKNVQIKSNIVPEVWTGVNRSEQLWSGVNSWERVWTGWRVNRWEKFWPGLNKSDRCEVLFFLDGESHALQVLPTPKTRVQVSAGTSLETLRPSQVVETVLRHASVGVRCEMVWSATFLWRTTMSERSLESSRLGEFGCEISPG